MPSMPRPPPPTRPPAQAAPASPHEIAATWQGTLHAGRDLRTMVKITKDDKGAYKGIFYSVDQIPQGAQPVNLDSVTLNGSDVKMELKLISVTFTGKLSSDGKTIDGNWSQGPNPLPTGTDPRDTGNRMGHPNATAAGAANGCRRQSQF